MPGAERFFVDTNVLLYSANPSAPLKQESARTWLACLWENGAGRLSWQVLHEFYVNASRKIRLDPVAARKTVQVLSKWKPVEPGLGLIERGWHWMDQAQIGLWDSLIVAAAERAGCRWLLSEDFQAGRRFDTVTVINPFTHAPDEYGLLQGRPRARES